MREYISHVREVNNARNQLSRKRILTSSLFKSRRTLFFECDIRIDFFFFFSFWRSPSKGVWEMSSSQGHETGRGRWRVQPPRSDGVLQTGLFERLYWCRTNGLDFKICSRRPELGKRTDYKKIILIYYIILIYFINDALLVRDLTKLFYSQIDSLSA